MYNIDEMLLIYDMACKMIDIFASQGIKDKIDHYEKIKEKTYAEIKQWSAA